MESDNQSKFNQNMGLVSDLIKELDLLKLQN